jgi:hypothetical protein
VLAMFIRWQKPPGGAARRSGPSRVGVGEGIGGRVLKSDPPGSAR